MRRSMLVAALLLSACAVPPAGAPPGATTVRAQPRPDTALPLARGETQLAVRAVSATAPDRDVAGATCRAESAYFTADFAAPALILFPDYGASAPAVTVRCRAGSAAGTAVAQPEAAWAGGMGGWPSVGISVGTGNQSGVGVGLGWWGGGATQAGSPVIRYPELRIPLG